MSDRLTLEIATPDRLLLSAEVDHVMLPSVDGYMGVLPGHAPLLAKLDIGVLSYLKDGAEHFFAVAGGFAEVLRHRVQVLVESGEPADEIDVARAEAARASAEERLTSDLSAADLEQFEVRLKRAVARISAAQHRGVGRP